MKKIKKICLICFVFCIILINYNVFAQTGIVTKEYGNKVNIGSSKVIIPKELSDNSFTVETVDAFGNKTYGIPKF